MKMSKNKEQAIKAIEDLLIEPDQVLYGNAVDDQGSLYPEVKIGLEIALKLLKENKMTVIDKVLEQIKKDVGMGDMTAIEELLSEVSEKILQGFLSEEKNLGE